MAGNYPDPVHPRIAYHLDGTIVVHLNATLDGVVKILDSGQMATINDNSPMAASFSNGISQPSGCAMIFPRLMALDAIFLNTNNQMPFGTWRWSPDTTDGIDGTWSEVANNYNTGVYIDPIARTDHESVSLSGVRAVRFEAGSGAVGLERSIAQINLFGTFDDDSDRHRLAIWDPASDQIAAPDHFEVGDVAQGTSRDVDFRVKNLSPIYTAHDVTVSMNVPADPAPSFDFAHEFQHDGGSFLTQIQIGDIGPGAISTPVTLRQTLQANAALSLQWGVIRAVPTSMTV